MPDNQPFVSPLNPPGFFPLDDHSVLALEGPEAIAFAHAQFSSDVSSLAVGHWQWSTWLTAKGRVLAVFALLRTGEHALRLVLPDVDAAELADALRRYVFRRKVTLAARPDLRVTGAFAAPAQARGPLLAGDEADGLELDYGTAALPRTLRLAGGPGATPPASTEAWSVADLRLGLPRLPPSQRGQWTPQQLALDRLAAFSVKKGCYPGQEIVARTHFLGQAKRGLAALCAAKPIPMGADVELDGTAIGKVVSATPGEACFALAVLPLDRGMGALTAAGLGLNDIGLRDGLAR